MPWCAAIAFSSRRVRSSRATLDGFFRAFLYRRMAASTCSGARSKGPLEVGEDFTRHRRRCHACSRAWSQIQKMCCAPSVGEGRNSVLRRGRFASLVSEAVHGRFSSSARNEEETGRPGMHTVSSAVRERRRKAVRVLYSPFALTIHSLTGYNISVIVHPHGLVSSLL
jgi:hypothetical protein